MISTMALQFVDNYDFRKSNWTWILIIICHRKLCFVSNKPWTFFSCQIFTKMLSGMFIRTESLVNNDFLPLVTPPIKTKFSFTHSWRMYWVLCAKHWRYKVKWDKHGPFPWRAYRLGTNLGKQIITEEFDEVIIGEGWQCLTQNTSSLKIWWVKELYSNTWQG